MHVHIGKLWRLRGGGLEVGERSGVRGEEIGNMSKWEHAHRERELLAFSCT